MEDRVDVGVGVVAVSQGRGEFLHVGDRVDLAGGHLAAEPAVQVAAYADVVAAAGELADVVDVVDQLRQRHVTLVGRVVLRTLQDHPTVEHDADNAAALGDGEDLFVAELAVMRHERAAVAVADEHGLRVDVHRLRQGGVADVRYVQDHAQPFELLDQFDAGVGERPVAAGAHGVGPRAVVRDARRAEPLVEPPLQMLGVDDRIAAFHAEDVADRQVVGRPPAPHVPDLVERLDVSDHSHLALLFEQSVVGQLSLCGGAGDCLVGEVEVLAEYDFAASAVAQRPEVAFAAAFVLGQSAAQHRRQADADAPFPQLGQTDGAVPTELARHARLGLTQLGD